MAFGHGPYDLTWSYVQQEENNDGVKVKAVEMVCLKHVAGCGEQNTKHMARVEESERSFVRGSLRGSYSVHRRGHSALSQTTTWGRGSLNKRGPQIDQRTVFGR